jgi:hypothetical protein
VDFLEGYRQIARAASTTSREAERVYGISRLASCIHEIRNVGYFVYTHMRQEDYGHKYARYEFVSRVN